MQAVHPVLALRERHHPPGGYPAGVVPVPGPIGGLAFFPGGHGLWNARPDAPLPAFPVGGIMVLGHDFHSETGYAKSLALGGEPLTLPTWGNMLRLFRTVGVPLDRCFFTNLYMGLRAGSATTGEFPGARDAAFVAHCQAFFLEQLRVQRPSLILTLGVHVPPVIGRLSPELASWSAGRGLRHLNTGPVRTDVGFEGVPDLRTTVVALIHPSLRHASLRYRRYGVDASVDPEVAMLRDGLEIAGLS